MPLYQVGVAPGHLAQPEEDQSPDAYIERLEAWRAVQGLEHPEGSPRARTDGQGGRLHTFATELEKVRATFHFFDTNRNSVIDPAEFAVAIEKSNFGLGNVTKEAWGLFLKRHPCLRDALYRRAVVQRDAALARRVTQADEGRLARLRVQAEMKMRAAEREVAGAETKLGLVTEQVRSCAREEEERSNEKQEAQLKEEAARIMRDKAAERMRHRDPSVVAAASHAKDLADEARRLREKLDSVAAREARAREMLRQAEEERREVEGALKETEVMLDRVRAGIAPGLTPEEEIQRAEMEIQAARTAERCLAPVLKEAARQTVKAQKELDKAQDAAAEALEVLEARRGEWEAAVHEETNNTERRKQAEEAIRLGPERLSDGTMTEAGQAVNLMVESELRLRFQKDAVSERERALRDARHSVFSHAPPRMSSPRRRRANQSKSPPFPKSPPLTSPT
eukprot:Hpha_TRINITY_DN6180_c0_g1::TRINITY_DN6180_c0_g1_i1::g.165033::m.165033